VASRWEIIEKDTIDEIIFRTTKTCNRLILELMAGGGMHIGEVLKLRDQGDERPKTKGTFYIPCVNKKN
jgi:hypothetical protein